MLLQTDSSCSDNCNWKQKKFNLQKISQIYSHLCLDQSISNRKTYLKHILTSKLACDNTWLWSHLTFTANKQIIKQKKVPISNYVHIRNYHSAIYIVCVYHSKSQSIFQITQSQHISIKLTLSTTTPHSPELAFYFDLCAQISILNFVSPHKQQQGYKV